MITITEQDLFADVAVTPDESLPTRLMTRVFVWNPEGLFGVVENKWPPHWFDLPGGGCEADEPVDDCVMRECLEEMGATVTGLEPIGLCDVWDQEQHIHFDIRYYSVQLVSLGERTTTDEREQNREIRWVEPGEYMNMIAEYIANEPRQNYQRGLLSTKYFLNHFFGY